MIQDHPEPRIEGNCFLVEPLFSESLHYVIVSDGEVPVAQQSFYNQGTRWWVDNLFVTERYRGTQVIRVLREATFRAIAKLTPVFYAWIRHSVASPSKILSDPIKLDLGLVVEEQGKTRYASKYRYDVSALQQELT